MSDTASVQNAMQKHLNPPEPPEDIATGYKFKRCFFCKCWSTDKAPWELVGTTLASWAPLLPWARGNKKKPVSDVCKICMIVSELCLLPF